ncbi:MAG: hypothetical protein RLZZ15_952, partial [Verrucomicrobiota bacterium]
PPAPLPADLATRRRVLVAAALLALAALAAWHNTFHVPFVLDDFDNISANATIRRLSALGDVLAPPAATGVGGRPILNLSFALNHAATGLSLGWLHATNLAIHVAAGLALFGLVRRTLRAPLLAARFGAEALPLAFAVALLWTLHPVQTASVTYLSQRAESLMGLFYLLTLYCFARALDEPAGVPGKKFHRHHAWLIAGGVACALGMGTKEVMVTAPLAVLLYDRTFAAGSFRAALRARPRFYLGLALTWTLVALSFADLAARGVGTHTGVTRLDYALTQCRAVASYLALAVWPAPLIFARDAEYLKTFSAAAPYALLLAPLLALTALALVRRPAAGFGGAWFFGLLAPTSSLLPVAYMPVAENRLYLPLAAVLALLVLTAHRWLGRRTLPAAIALATALLLLTERRNHDYRSDLALWRDTVEKSPANPQALYNYGFALSRAGENSAAAAQWRATLREQPAHPAAADNLANTLVALGRTDEALRHYAAALRRLPDFSVLRANYGFVLLSLGRIPEAEAQLRLAVKQDPAYAAAHHNLAVLLDRTGRNAQALAAFATALRLLPDYALAHHNLGIALARAGRIDEAAKHFRTAARLRPADAESLLNLSRVFLDAQRLPDAQTAAAEAVARFPGSADAHLALGNVLALQGQAPAAIAEYERALLLRAEFPAARDNLAILRATLGR